jgi:simple sugar transport system permease protein
MNQLLKSILSPLFGFAIFRVMTPILFPALGAGISSQSGAINISIEGSLLMSALIGVVVSAFTQSMALAVLAGVASGMFISLVLAILNLKLKANIIIAAIALNLFASGFTIFFLFLTTQSKGTTASLKSLLIPNLELPLIRSIPVLGEVISGHNLLTYFALVSVFLYRVLLYNTSLGLRIRAVGQSPEAAVSTGIDPVKVQLTALLLSGFFSSFGGVFLTMGYTSSFGRDMTAGRGFIGLAIAVVARNEPLPILLYSFVFATAITLATYLGSIEFPSELIQTIPYIITIIVLTVYSYVEKRGSESEIS